nr:unnamed protein product [Callosobruchus chinensis]
MSQEEDIVPRQLVHQRGVIKSALMRFSKFVEAATDDKVLQLEMRLDRAMKLLEEYNIVQDSLDFHSENDIETNERELFENSYFEIIEQAKVKIMEFQGRNSGAGSVRSQSTSNGNSQDNVKFPVIELPKFSGEYDKWGQFRDMFVALVHNEPGIDNIKKFYYLLSSLKTEG